MRKVIDMKKLIGSVVALFVSGIFNIGNIGVVHAYPKPQKVFARSTNAIEIFGTSLQYNLEFWNVGALDQAGQYDELLVTIDCVGEGCVENDVVAGTFSGGPNGTFNVNGINFNLIDGKATTVFDAGYELIFTVDNPEAFSGDWSGQEYTKEGYIELPTDEEAVKAPTGEGVYVDYSFPKVNRVMGEVLIHDPSKSIDLLSRIWKTVRHEKDVREWNLPTEGQQITNNTALKTGLGRAVIEFDDGTKFILDKGSSITFQAGGFSIDNGAGMMSYKKTGTKIILQNKRAKFGILGTTVAWDESEEQSVFQVLEGTVEVESLIDGQTAIMEAGKEIVADDSGLEAGAVNVQEELGRWQSIESEAEEQGYQTSNNDIRWVLVVVGIVIVVFLIFVVLVIVLFIINRKKRKYGRGGIKG